MEKNKNAGIEKVEEITNETQPNSSVKKSNPKTKRAKTQGKNARVKKSDAKKEKQAKKSAIRQEKIQKRNKAIAEKKKMRQAKRLEAERLKAHKRAEKDKARATALREKNRRKFELKERKEQLKAEKQERKELLKNETKKDRQKRIALEKAEKRQAKERAREDRQNIKRQKLESKRAEKEQKIKNKQKNKEQGRSFGGWLAAVISLGVATLVLASAFTFVVLMPSDGENMLETSYRKSFYDTVAEVQNMDMNLSKALATKDTVAMQVYLLDTAVNSELAENNLQQLPLQDENKFYTTKLVNQIGDFSKYLNKKLAQGEDLSESDRAALVQLYQANASFKDTLTRAMRDMGNNYNFSAMGGKNDLVIANFNELQNLSVEYPELIYDGPFSDGQDEMEIKGLSGNEITEAEAESIFTKIFADFGIMDVKSVGESNGTIQCYNVQANVEGDVLYGQISKKGGKLIMFAYSGSCNSTEYTSDYIVNEAEEFLSKLGINKMQAVWINNSNNVYTINFAYEQDDVVVYPDLVKVRVCAETGKVIGMEATRYYTNHTDRVINDEKITKSTASKSVSDFVSITDSRLALIPIGTKTEKLCYEFVGEYDGSTYYVYIDAVNGRQVEMFKVVESESEGSMLM